MNSKLTNLNLSAPWVEFYQEIKALFGDDPAIRIDYNKDEKVISLRVEGQDKAEALEALLPKEKTFGNVTVKLLVIPANLLQTSRLSLFQAAFEGNPAFSYAKEVEPSVAAFGASYVVFKKKVVQFFNDDLSDVYGVKSTLYEEIARDVFGPDAGVFFCTDREDA